MKTNFEILMDTINTFKYSQGFYGRLERDIKELSEEELEDFKNQINSERQFNDILDCVLYLEQ